METLQEGYLERCLNTDSLKEWKTNYFVFQKNLSSGSKTLEFFKDDGWKKQEPRGVCNLYSRFSVQKIKDPRHQCLFELKTVDKSYVLRAPAEQAYNKWVDVLQKPEESAISTYKVLLVDSPATAVDFVKHCVGVCELRVGTSAITLHDTAGGTVWWKFATIRRYKSHGTTFNLEVGRKASTGEGVFKFELDNPGVLFDTLEKAVKDEINRRGLHEVINQKMSNNNNSKNSTNNINSLKSNISSDNNNNNTPSSNIKPSNNMSSNNSPSSNIKPNSNNIASSVQHGRISPPDLPKSEENEYNHLHSACGKNQKNVAANNNNNEYDVLFDNPVATPNKNARLVPSQSSPVGRSLEEKKFPSDISSSNRRLSSKTLFSTIANQGEYQAMSGNLLGNTMVATPRPKPPPRTKRRGSEPLLDLLPVVEAAAPTQDSEYDSLNFSKPAAPQVEPQMASEYNHLSAATKSLQKVLTPTHSVEDYDSPESVKATITKGMPKKPLVKVPVAKQQSQVPSGKQQVNLAALSEDLYETPQPVVKILPPKPAKSIIKQYSAESYDAPQPVVKNIPSSGKSAPRKPVLKPARSAPLVPPNRLQPAVREFSHRVVNKVTGYYAVGATIPGEYSKVAGHTNPEEIYQEPT